MTDPSVNGAPRLKSTHRLRWWPEAKHRQRTCWGGDGWLSKTPETFRINLLGRCCFLKAGEGEHVYGLDDPPGGICAVASGSLAISMAPQQY